MPTQRGWALTGSGLALAWMWYLLGEIELLVAALVLLGAQLFAMALVRACPSNIALTRFLTSTTVNSGDFATVTLRVSNSSRRAARSLVITDTVEVLGTARFELAKLAGRSSSTASYRVECHPRGVFHVGPGTVTCRDPFGLAEAVVATGPIDRIVVYPRVESLSGFPVVRGQDPAMQASRPEHSRRGGEDFYTLREYQRGDDLRRVHWPYSAKTDELMIRQLETPWQSRALVLLDVRGDSYETEESFEKAVAGAATVVTHLVGAGFDADLWAGQADPIDATRYRAAMERLALVQTDEVVDLTAVAGRIRQSGGGGALVILTGLADRELLGIRQMLVRDYPTTILMSVSDSTSQTLLGFQRLGATTITIRTDGAWSPAWAASLRTTWNAVSVG